jgi:hypothetical protein
MWNWRNCMFIDIQNVFHLNGAKDWYYVFSVFCTFGDQFVTLIFNILLCTGWSLHYFGRMHNSHVNATEPELHLETGSNTCLHNFCTPPYYKTQKLKNRSLRAKKLQVVRSSPSHTGRLYPQEYSWYSYSLGAESNPGPWCGRKELCHWKIQWHRRKSIPGPSD